MSVAVAVYRRMTWLYPKDFRAHYGDDLVQHFADVAADRGLHRAVARTSLDLVVTVPRYRLEHIMTAQQSSTALNLGVLALAGAGLWTLAAGALPGAALLLVAVALAVTQRTSLARSLRAPAPDRRRRLAIGGVLAGAFVLAIASYLHDISDDHISGASLMIHDIVGLGSLIGALGYLTAGFLGKPRAGAA